MLGLYQEHLENLHPAEKPNGDLRQIKRPLRYLLDYPKLHNLGVFAASVSKQKNGTSLGTPGRVAPLTHPVKNLWLPRCTKPKR